MFVKNYRKLVEFTVYIEFYLEIVASCFPPINASRVRKGYQHFSMTSGREIFVVGHVQVSVESQPVGHFVIEK